MAGVTVRTFADPADIAPWLALREAAFFAESRGVRHWANSDFHREFTLQSWWRPDWMWLAETSQASDRITSPRKGPDPDEGSFRTRPALVGSVTLALRSGRLSQQPAAIHWLMVSPAWRRRGIARMLVSHLERTAWEAGYRTVCLETHSAWSAAAACYAALGYFPC